MYTGKYTEMLFKQGESGYTVGHSDSSLTRLTDSSQHSVLKRGLTHRTQNEPEQFPVSAPQEVWALFTAEHEPSHCGGIHLTWGAGGLLACDRAECLKWRDQAELLV